jgi:hypothetical protein
MKDWNANPKVSGEPTAERKQNGIMITPKLCRLEKK